MDSSKLEQQKNLIYSLQGKNIFRQILALAMRLFDARVAGVLFGTDSSGERFLPATSWDRGIMHAFAGRGLEGLVLRFFGRFIVTRKGLSPVMFFRHDQAGHRQGNDGIISYVLRHCVDFYQRGINVIIVPRVEVPEGDEEYITLPVLSYNGSVFGEPEEKLRASYKIIKEFRASNFLSVYIPDYGILVVSDVAEELLRMDRGRFVDEAALKEKLDKLIDYVEMVSLACLFTLKGRRGAELLWRKELFLREAGKELNRKEKALRAKEAELEQQRRYLRAVGAVTATQLDMEPVEEAEAVFCFIDMVGSARIRQRYTAKEYFFLTNACRQIVANLAGVFRCRLDNYIGDAIFVENVPAFDDPGLPYRPGGNERAVLVTLMLIAVYYELNQLAKGEHPIDPEGKVMELLAREGQILTYRAGVEAGNAVVGPIGSKDRKIVTGIGAAVDHAARLEATGEPYAIHMSENFFRLLTETVLSRETRLVYQVLANLDRSGLFAEVRARLIDQKNLPFSELLALLLGAQPGAFPQAVAAKGVGEETSDTTGESLFREVNDISYKEYHPKKTFLLKVRF